MKFSEVDDQHAIDVANFIANNRLIAMRGVQPGVSASDDLRLVEVVHLPASSSVLLECWFNCLREQKAGNGTAIYGWAIYKTSGKPTYEAQHHGVLLTSEGLVNVTPISNEIDLTNSGKILFLPDSRVPFNDVDGKYPASLRYSPGAPGQFEWGAIDTNGTWKRFNRFTVINFGEDTCWRTKLP